MYISCKLSVEDTLVKKIEDRLCTICNNIEDEVHFLCECIKHQLFHSKMHVNIDNMFSGVSSEAYDTT